MVVHELAQAMAAIRKPAATGAATGQPLSVRAPVSGVRLRVPLQSEATVAAGASLLDIGDPLRMEVLAELWTTDAVNAKPGDITAPPAAWLASRSSASTSRHRRWPWICWRLAAPAGLGKERTATGPAGRRLSAAGRGERAAGSGSGFHSSPRNEMSGLNARHQHGTQA